MESMAAYLRDMDMQGRVADRFAPPAPLGRAEQANAVFTGSGDSMAAAMLAEAFSDYRARALDPQVLWQNPGIISGRELYIVSVSGRTAANIRLAKACDSVAITAKPDSGLAGAARRTIPLSFPNSDVLTAGSISFLNSALVCISLVRPVSLSGTGRMLERARADAARAGMDAAEGSRTYFVGNQHTFPVAMYAAAKAYEILGGDAHYSRTEQFGHMELFSAKPKDRIIFFDDTECVRQMSDSLKSQGISCTITDSRLDDTLQDVIYHIFYAQSLPLGASRGRAEVYFMEADRLRGTSDDAIY